MRMAEKLTPEQLKKLSANYLRKEFHYVYDPDETQKDALIGIPKFDSNSSPKDIDRITDQHLKTLGFERKANWNDNRTGGTSAEMTSIATSYGNMSTFSIRVAGKISKSL